MHGETETQSPGQDRRISHELRGQIARAGHVLHSVNQDRGIRGTLQTRAHANTQVSQRLQRSGVNVCVRDGRVELRRKLGGPKYALEGVRAVVRRARQTGGNSYYRRSIAVIAAGPFVKTQNSRAAEIISESRAGCTAICEFPGNFPEYFRRREFIGTFRAFQY